MKTVDASEAGGRLRTLMKEVAAAHEPIRIVGKDQNAVLVAESDWNAITETLHLIAVPGTRESIREGLVEPVEECAADLEW